jgi:hypothetical protein
MLTSHPKKGPKDSVCLKDQYCTTQNPDLRPRAQPAKKTKYLLDPRKNAIRLVIAQFVLAQKPKASGYKIGVTENNISLSP